MLCLRLCFVLCLLLSVLVLCFLLHVCVTCVLSLCFGLVVWCCSFVVAFDFVVICVFCCCLCLFYV